MRFVSLPPLARLEAPKRGIHYSSPKAHGNPGGPKERGNGSVIGSDPTSPHQPHLLSCHVPDNWGSENRDPALGRHPRACSKHGVMAGPSLRARCEKPSGHSRSIFREKPSQREGQTCQRRVVNLNRPARGEEPRAQDTRMDVDGGRDTHGSSAPQLKQQ